MVGSATRNPRAISAVVRQAIRRSVRATRPPATHRMARDEDQAQQVVLDLLAVEVSDRRVRGVQGLDLELVSEFSQPRANASCRRMRSMARRFAIVTIRAPGLRRYTRLRPLLESGDQRVLRQILG